MANNLGEAESVIAVLNGALIAGVNVYAAVQKVSQQIAAARAVGAALTPAQLAAAFADDDAVFAAVQSQLQAAAGQPSV